MPELLDSIRNHLAGNGVTAYTFRLPVDQAPQDAVAVMEIAFDRKPDSGLGRHIQVQVRRAHPATGMQDAVRILKLVMDMPVLNRAWCLRYPYYMRNDSQGLCIFACDRGSIFFSFKINIYGKCFPIEDIDKNGNQNTKPRK